MCTGHVLNNNTTCHIGRSITTATTPTPTIIIEQTKITSVMERCNMEWKVQQCGNNLWKQNKINFCNLTDATAYVRYLLVDLDCYHFLFYMLFSFRNSPFIHENYYDKFYRSTAVAIWNRCAFGDSKVWLIIPEW